MAGDGHAAGGAGRVRRWRHERRRRRQGRRCPLPRRQRSLARRAQKPAPGAGWLDQPGGPALDRTEVALHRQRACQRHQAGRGSAEDGHGGPAGGPHLLHSRTRRGADTQRRAAEGPYRTAERPRCNAGRDRFRRRQGRAVGDRARRSPRAARQARRCRIAHAVRRPGLLAPAGSVARRRPLRSASSWQDAHHRRRDRRGERVAQSGRGGVRARRQDVQA